MLVAQVEGERGQGSTLGGDRGDAGVGGDADAHLRRRQPEDVRGAEQEPAPVGLRVERVAHRELGALRAPPPDRRGQRVVAVRAHVGERRRARAAVQVLVGAPDGDVDAGTGHVDLDCAGGVAEVPHDHGAVLGGAGGLGGEVDPRRRAEVDERTQGHVDARQVVAPAAHRRSRRRGDAGHHVAVGGEVARIDGDHPGPVVGDGPRAACTAW